MKKKIIIIGEAGVNHNGNVKKAKQLIDIASKAGVDIIKFQTFSTERLVTKFAKKATYQKNIKNPQQSQYRMLKALELSRNDHYVLKKYCKKKKIEFLSTAFDNESVLFLNKLKIKRFKIPSGEITNIPYLKYIGKFNKPIIMSTGMSTLLDIKKALNILFKAGAKKKYITLLHCNTEYPTPKKNVNLKAMLTLKNYFGLKIGYSDHTLGIEIPIAAAALGAKVIEKHFTFNRNQVGPDHKTSLEPKELETMVKSIRNVEEALGNGIKKPSKKELQNMSAVRKSIVALKNIKKGEKFSENNLTLKRPGNGISPIKFYKIIGKNAKKSFLKDELIKI